LIKRFPRQLSDDGLNWTLAVNCRSFSRQLTATGSLRTRQLIAAGVFKSFNDAFQP